MNDHGSATPAAGLTSRARAEAIEDASAAFRALEANPRVSLGQLGQARDQLNACYNRADAVRVAAAVQALQDSAGFASLEPARAALAL